MSQLEADKTGYRGTNEGGKLKATDSLHWKSPNTGAINESGFSALPAGWRCGPGEHVWGRDFYGLGNSVHFWTSTDAGNDSNSDWDRTFLEVTIYQVEQTNSFYLIPE